MTVSLDDKFVNKTGTILINGNQALIRLLLLQGQIDQHNNLNTAAYVSGYRGSPLGGFDSALWSANDLLNQHNIVFQPGVNEELAATAVWGTQQLNNYSQAKVDGVYSIWYGKGPGVDRAGDALKHGNITGSHPYGGVLAVFGDDHPGKSSTTAHQSEHAMAANSLPVIYPADVSEFVRFGLWGWAASRYSGLWISYKVVNETVGQTLTVNVDDEIPNLIIPSDGIFPPQGVHYRPRQFTPQLDSDLVVHYKLPLLQQFAQINRLDRIVIDSSKRKLGIIAAGKNYHDTRQALHLLGLDESRCAQLGITLYKPGLIWPLEPAGLNNFSQHQQTLLIIEEKKAFIELQVKEQLYGSSQQPVITGKQDEKGQPLLPSEGLLNAVIIAQAIAGRLAHLGIITDEINNKVTTLSQRLQQKSNCNNSLARTPVYCSGCPHSQSTRVPEGAISMAGIGCHSIAVIADPSTLTFTQMGGEGANWYGISRFVETPHVFQNMGDGTYFHSGLLAIRGAVASGANITYKILFNDAVAMTGGQPVDGPLSVADMTWQLQSEGVKKIAVVSDKPQLYRGNARLADDTLVFHRDQLDQVQRDFSHISGTTAIIYEQTCATEKRRRRKRGKLEQATAKLFINPDVCEGCGDCSIQSGCVSLHPLETAFGRKRQIHQDSCNQDYSCVKGLCPAFVSVEGGELQKPSLTHLNTLVENLPEPTRCEIDQQYNVVIAGIGGTGTVTAGALLAMAALIDNRASSVFDMTGLAQKGGAVFSHVKFATQADKLYSQQIGFGEANLLLGCDAVALQNDEAIQTLSANTSVLLNSNIVPTSAFLTDRNLDLSIQQIVSHLQQHIASEQLQLIAAGEIAEQLIGQAMATNLVVIGYALQKGLLPISVAALEQAITLNKVAVDSNLMALSIGRLFAVNPEKIIQQLPPKPATPQQMDLNELIMHRYRHLIAYQDKQYAQTYRDTVETVAKAEQALGLERTDITRTVAINLAKLMAYKDEYEVARLYSHSAFSKAVNSAFKGNFRLGLYLAPPLFSRIDKTSGRPFKRHFGQWIFALFPLLAKMKRLRHTAFDPFGYLKERKQERELIKEYQSLLTQISKTLTRDNYTQALQLCQLPDQVRGYGTVKEQAIEKMKAQLAEQLPIFIERIGSGH